jgi:hypothetical protein
LFFLSRYMGIGLSAQGVNMNRLPGKNINHSHPQLSWAT